MPNIPFDVVAFDLDGTLADTAPDLAAALNHALAALGREAIAPESVRHLVGHGARALLRKGLAATGEASEELVEQGFPIFIDYYAAHICDGTAAYPELEEALDALAADGLKLAICTNKPEALTHRLLEALGWQERFASVVGGDTLSVRKPDPAPLFEAVQRAGGGHAAFVGDSITDADTARAARVPFIAVSFGFSDRPVEALGADIVIDRYVDLFPALARLGAGS
ncbi:MAG TPA: phosphoglycolate phosphatase [Allosphingosinicella sp.]|uniref:phosphoglycolate phosphatase n=1 Tax=Allosphingosinicella sp. TaxID=2823234 RepID=UPI002ED8D31B